MCQCSVLVDTHSRYNPIEYLKDTNTVCQVLSRAKAGGGSLPIDEGSRLTTEKWLPDGRRGIHSHREPQKLVESESESFG